MAAASSVGSRPARRSVMTPSASRVQKLHPGGHVARLELEADAGRRQGAAADLVGERVVAEQAEVAGARPGGDAPGHRVVEAQGALAGQPVEVGGAASVSSEPRSAVR